VSFDPPFVNVVSFWAFSKRRKTDRVVVSPTPDVEEGQLPSDMDVDHPYVP
jgi:hypothetical protein